MLDRKFLNTRPGQASLLSITAMVTFVVLSPQITSAAPLTPIAYPTVELA